jgi:hypothetical protein
MAALDSQYQQKIIAEMERYQELIKDRDALNRRSVRDRLASKVAMKVVAQPALLLSAMYPEAIVRSGQARQSFWTLRWSNRAYIRMSDLAAQVHQTEASWPPEPQMLAQVQAKLRCLKAEQCRYCWLGAGGNSRRLSWLRSMAGTWTRSERTMSSVSRGRSSAMPRCKRWVVGNPISRMLSPAWQDAAM